MRYGTPLRHATEHTIVNAKRKGKREQKIFEKVTCKIFLFAEKNRHTD